jgi:hypothetical protein
MGGARAVLHPGSSRDGSLIHTRAALLRNRDVFDILLPGSQYGTAEPTAAANALRGDVRLRSLAAMHVSLTLRLRF